MVENGIRRVSWLPKKLDQQIEEARMKIGYTRSAFFRYALTRLIEQTLLSPPTNTQLNLWEEIIGTLETIEKNNDNTTAKISITKNATITLPTNTPQTTLQQLQKLQGQKVAILRTDNPERPIAIRTFYETTEAYKKFCALLWFRKRVLFVLRCGVFVKGGMGFVAGL
jgi:metal-responsive CopG/Arc/MetJ family transcriptional regulator